MMGRRRHETGCGTGLGTRRRAPVWARLFVLGLLLLVADRADAGGVRLGVRAGYAELDGTLYDLDLKKGETRLFGIQVILPLLTDRLALQVAGEGTSDELELTGDGVDSASRGSVDWQDLAIYTSLRAELLPVGLLGLYVGAGIGIHFTELDEDQLAEVLEEAQEDIEDELGGSSSDLEWHGVAGLSFALGSLFELFGEGRYRWVEGELERHGPAGYIGLNLRLP